MLKKFVRRFVVKQNNTVVSYEDHQLFATVAFLTAVFITLVVAISYEIITEDPEQVKTEEVCDENRP